MRGEVLFMHSSGEGKNVNAFLETREYVQTQTLSDLEKVIRAGRQWKGQEEQGTT